MAELAIEIVANAQSLNTELAKAQTGVKSLDATLIKLGKTSISLNTATNEFVTQLAAGTGVIQQTADAQQVLNAVGVRTSRQFQEQIRVLTTLRSAYRNDIAVVRQLDQQLELLQRQAAGVNRAMVGVGRSTGKTSQVFFQAGQAVSDFAVAGIRGAANNLEFLALQLGASGPLILAITAATVAFIAFEDQIINAVSGGGAALKELTKDVKDVSDSLIQLSKDTKVTFSGSLSDLESDAERVTSIINALEEEAKKLRLQVAQEQTQDSGRGATFVATLSEEGQKAKEELSRVNDVLARQKGIRDSLNETIQEEKILQQVIADLEGTSLNRKEEEVKKEKEKVSELEKLVKKNEELLAILDKARRGEDDKLLALRDQNKALTEQIKIVREINKARNEFGSLDAGASSVTGAGLIAPGAGATFSEAGGFNFRGIAEGDRQGLIDQLRGDDPIEQLSAALSLGLENLRPPPPDVAEGLDEIGESTQRLIDLNQQLADSFRGALTDSVTSFFAALGTGGDPFKALRTSVGSFMVDMGRTFIAFGIAGESIKAFAKGNPVAAIIAGGALVALGSALKKSAEDKASNFGSGAVSAQDAGPGFVDPRQGRTGRFQRDTDSLVEARSPFGLDNLRIIGEFTQRGTDMVAVVERVQRRQTRTRG